MAGEIKTLCGKTLHDIVARTKITELVKKIDFLEKNGVGTPGKDGVGIASVKQTTTSTTDSGVNIITVTKTDGTKYTFQVVNGSKGFKGDTGATGPQGIQGETGPKGDTGAQGIQGPKGEKGDKGDTGSKGDKGDTGSQGIQGVKGDTGSKGDKGDAGVGIASVVQTVTSTADSGINEVEVTLTDGTKSTLKIRNGSGTGFPAYDYAQEAGFTGTPEEFYMGLADSAGAVWHANMIKGKGDLLLTATSIYDDGLGASLGKATLPTDMEEIIVDFDNVSYICKITKETNGVSFGNANIYSSSKPNTNEPFYIKSLNNSFMVYLRDKSARPTISLYDFGLSYNKLPKEFLPDDIPTSGGCSADWSQNDENGAGYVKNRTHWVESGVEVLSETTLSITDGKAEIYEVLDIVEGDAYSVYWNGIEYKITAKPLTIEGMTLLGLGNFALVGGENTGEPFAIGIVKNMGTMVMVLDGSTSATLKITGDKYHQLDKRFIPKLNDNIIFYVDGTNSDFTVTSNKTMEELLKASPNELLNALIAKTVEASDNVTIHYRKPFNVVADNVTGFILWFEWGFAALRTPACMIWCNAETGELYGTEA